MNLKLTQRDKRLLTLAGCAAIAVLCWQFLLSPALRMKQDLTLEVEQLSLELTEQEREIGSLEQRKEEAAQSAAELAEASQSWYAPLATREMDNIITGLLLENELFPEELTLIGREPSLPGPYLFAPAENALEGTDAQDYISVGTARLIARGSEEQWRAFLDNAAALPGLRVVRFSLEEETYAKSDRETVTDSRIDCTLEVYMCENGEEAQP